MREYFRLVKLLKPYRHLLVLSFLLMIIFSITNALTIYLSIPLLKTLFTSDSTIPFIIPAQQSIFNSIRSVIDSYIFSSGNKYDALLKACALLVVTYFIKNLIGYLQSILTQYVENTLITDLRRRMYHKFNSLSLKYFSRKKSGDLISRFITDVNSIQNTVSVTFTDLIKQPLLIITFLTMAFLLNWKLTLISIVIVPLSLLLIFWIGRKLRKYSMRIQEKLGNFTSVISETIYGSKVIRAFSMEKSENKKFESKLKDFFRTKMKIEIYSDSTRPITEFVSVCIGVIIIWYGGKEIFHGSSLAPEEFIGFILIIFQLMTPIKDLSSVGNRIQEASAASKRIFEIIDSKPEIIEIQNPAVKDSFEQTIEFKNVSFRYDVDLPLVLDNVSFTANKNEKVAIVGLSGVGKSTLVDLLPRFYDPVEGNIFIDGVNIKELSLKSLRSMFGIVTQEIILFNDTIKSNIAYGREDISESEIINATKNANAHDFILETENGYDTIIGDRGIKLSGGQRQRIAIARALLKSAPILIFDEATSSLDTESETLIQEAIDLLIKNHTSIIIAHRLSTIKNADKIIVLHEGKIESINNHDKLITKQESIYKKLYEMQFRT